MRGKCRLELLFGAGAVFSLAWALAVLIGRTAPLPPGLVAYGAPRPDAAAEIAMPKAAPEQFALMFPVMTALADGV